MKGFHQQLTVMRKGLRTYQPQSLPQQQVIHTQPSPQHAQTQLNQVPQIQPHLQQLSHAQPYPQSMTQAQPHLQQLSHTHPYTQPLTQAQPHLQQANQIQPHLHQMAHAQPSYQQTQPHPQALLQHQNQSQSSLLQFPQPTNVQVQSEQQACLSDKATSFVNSLPGTVSYGKGMENESSKGGKTVEVICIDSDSDSEESSVYLPHPSFNPTSGSGVLVPSQTSGDSFCSNNNISTSLSTPGLATPLTDSPGLHPSFNSSSLPVATVPPSIPCSSFHDMNKTLHQQTDQSKSHTPSEAAVASALAGFVQFQKNICKDLGQDTEAETAKLALNTLANTLQVFSQTDPPTTIAPAISSSEVPASTISPTGMGEFSSPLSPLSAIMSSLQDGSRKAAIVTPIIHHPPTTSS